MVDRKSKTALVTGGTRGIGRAIAVELGRLGFSLALTGRRPAAEVSGTIDEISALTDVAYFASDVADLSGHAALVEECSERFGSIELLVNNAGVAPEERVDVLQASPDSYDRVLSVNLRGPHFLTQRVARHMVERVEGGGEPGMIVNVTSISSVVASPSRGEYCISKAGQSMSSLLWAVRLAEYGIAVYDIRPGVIRTDMTEGVVAKYKKLVADGMTLQPRLGDPEDVGRAVAMLARGDLRYSTGQVIYVDGGMLVHRL